MFTGYKNRKSIDEKKNSSALNASESDVYVYICPFMHGERQYFSYYIACV